jgi:hypothetical protein
VKLARDVTDLFEEQALDQGMNIFVGCVGPSTLLEAGAHPCQAPAKCFTFFGVDHSRRLEGTRPRHATFDVLWPEPQIHIEAEVEPAHLGC